MRRLVGFLLLLPLFVVGIVAALGLLYASVPPVSTLMLARWATGRSAERTYVPLEAISPHLPLAVIASEDARFCSHGGVDWNALREVVDDGDEGGPNRGASTLTMQIAKNLFLWSSRSYVRKGLELPVALYLDLIWSKRRTIEVYLNVAEWGDGIFGAEAAAREHFGKSARELTRREAALLASALPNPIARDPGRPGPRQRAIVGVILGRMGETDVRCLS